MSITHAIIYCRVSSARQVKEGHGLSSQETRCREYARHKNYEVVKTFSDEGVSGSIINRPGMQAMLKYLKAQKDGPPVVVLIDDISRLARGLEAHLDLRSSIAEAGGKLESPSIEFGEDSDSILVENLLASVSQHQRQKNAEQVKNRMRARLMNGYWIGKAPYGYKYERVSKHGKLLVPHEPLASIVREALEGYACGRFDTRPEVKNFLERHSAFPTGRDGRVHYQRVDDMLHNPLYAGYVHFPNWGVVYQLAQHEALISFDAWQIIQSRLEEQAKTPARPEVEEDFPLRGFVSCASCRQLLTACWSQGRKLKYPYYHCFNPDCPEYKKSIRKEKMETQFEELLEDIQPSEDMFQLVVSMLRNTWEQGEENTDQEASAIKGELSQIEKQINQFLDRIVSVDSPSVVKAYENRLKDLEFQKAKLSMRLADFEKPQKGFNQTFRTALELLRNPRKIWSSGEIEVRKMLLKLVFTHPLEYRQKSGFRTPLTSCPFRLFLGFQGGDYDLVDPIGIEPTTSTMPL
ncbi:MAG: recombinase family protein [Bdellovibrionales bacterium]